LIENIRHGEKIYLSCCGRSTCSKRGGPAALHLHQSRTLCLFRNCRDEQHSRLRCTRRDSTHVLLRFCSTIETLELVSCIAMHLITQQKTPLRAQYHEFTKTHIQIIKPRVQALRKKTPQTEIQLRFRTLDSNIGDVTWDRSERWTNSWSWEEGGMTQVVGRR
jgi:hypothetical protein